jgi:hypothetical protein
MRMTSLDRLQGDCRGGIVTLAGFAVLWFFAYSLKSSVAQRTRPGPNL